MADMNFHKILKEFSVKEVTKKLTIFVTLLIMFTVSGLNHSAVWAIPFGQEGFSQDFASGELEGWEMTPDVTVVDGKLRLYGGNFAMKFGDWGDQEMKLELSLSSAEGEFIIHYFATDSGSYNLILTPMTMLLEKGGRPGDQLILAEAPYQRLLETWLEIGIKVENETHTVSVDDEVILTADDPDPLRPGGMGFHYFGPGSADIDQVILTPTGGDAVYEQPPEEVDHLETAVVTPQDPASTDNLLDSLQGIFSPRNTQMDLMTFAINLLLSVLMAFILGRVYIYWGGALSNRRKFAANFMLMTITTTFIILVVRSSVALSLGLVGALSIVRFRTAVKEPEELAYLFFAIGIGIGLGDNQRLITLVAFALVILILGLMKLFRQHGADVNLHLTVTGNHDGGLTLDQIMASLEPHTDKLKLLRLDDSRDLIEAAFLVEFKHTDDLIQAKSAIKMLDPQASITFLDNKGIW